MGRSGLKAVSSQHPPPPSQRGFSVFLVVLIPKNSLRLSLGFRKRERSRPESSKPKQEVNL